MRIKNASEISHRLERELQMPKKGFYLSIIVTLFVLGGFFGCKKVSDKPLVSPEKLKELAKEYIYKKHPDLDADAQFSFHEYRIKDIESLQIRIVSVSFSQKGWSTIEKLLVYHNGKLFPLAPVFGGYGLMSAVVFKGHLYCTYSFGSGENSSYLTRLSIVGGKLTYATGSPLGDENCFVKIKDSKLILEIGKMGGHYVFELNPSGGIKSEERFNLWTTEHYVGEVKPNKKGFTVIDKDGKIVENFTGRAYTKELQE